MASIICSVYAARVSFIYTYAKAGLLKGDIDLESGVIQLMLLKRKAFTSCDTELGAQFVGDFSVLGEIVASNYTRKSLASKVVTVDLPNQRADFVAADITFVSLGGLVNDTIGSVLIYKFGTSDADSIPIAYVDAGGLDFGLLTNGADVALVWPSTGILQEV